MYICVVERLTKYNINCISIKRTIINFLKINKMKGKKFPVRIYHFELDVVCKKLLLNHLEFAVPSRTFRSAWRLASDVSTISGYLAYLGYPNITVQKVIFCTCDVFGVSSDCKSYKIKTIDKVR